MAAALGALWNALAIVLKVDLTLSSFEESEQVLVPTALPPASFVSRTTLS